MPNMDRTGPQGNGPMTGRGLGPCSNGMRRGFGRNCKRMGNPRFFARFTKDEEKKFLEADLKEIDLEKQEIEKRLKEIK